MAITSHKYACLLALAALLCALIATQATATGPRRDGCRAKASRHHSSSGSRRAWRASRCDGRSHLGIGRTVARIPRVPTTPAPDKSAPDPVQSVPERPRPEVVPRQAPDPDPEPKPTPEPEPVPVPEPDPQPESDPVPPLAEPPPSTPPPTPSSIYWGAWIKGSAGEAPWSMSAASNFEQMAGKGLSLINWSSPFHLSACNGYCSFQADQFNAVRNHGAIPFFSWNPGPGGGAFTDAAVAAGSQDSYLTTWAAAAKQWGHPFFLRFAWEMNGSWFPWGVGNNGTTAADYVAMWRHVHDIFDSVGADNATWIWCPNIDPYGKRTPLASIYPGDAYVDWTCLDGYNGANPWTSFRGLFKSSYDEITGTIAPSKPVIIGETASTEAGGSKAQWIADALKALPADFPKVHGLLWFDKVESGPGGHSDWPVESSATAIDAFATGIQSTSYLENDYGSIGTSPIPTP